jgi:hypothetical protein
MSKPMRVPLGACAAVLALALAHPATAAYTPKLAVGGGGTTTTVRVTWPDADDPTARVTLYAPAGYQLGAPAVGAQIGTGEVVMLGKAPENAKVPLTGAIRATDPTTTATRTEATACTGTPTHEQTWTLSLSLGGSGQNPLVVLAFVDRTTTAETTLGSVKVQFCFRSPDLTAEQGGEGRGRPVFARLSLTGALTAPVTAGDFLWRGIFTPFTSGTPVTNAGGTKEAQSILRVPRTATLKAKRTGRTRMVRGTRVTTYAVRLSGQVAEGGTRLGGVTIRILRNGKQVKTLRTNEDAGFSIRLALAKTATFRVRAVVAERSTSCQGASVAPAGCTGATVVNWAGKSDAVRVVKPKRVKPTPKNV